jgi:[protein-PII] uridylyltransferase
LEVIEPGLLDGDRVTLVKAHERLVEARIALGRRTGRRGDVLLLQEQDGVAVDLGYQDADELMAVVAGSARTVGWLTDEKFDQVSLAGSRFRRRPKERRLGGGAVLRDGQIHLDDDVAPGALGCVQLLDVARTAATREVRLARATLEHFAQADLRFPDPWPAEVRERFVELLRCGHAAIPVIETLDHWGLWVRVVPEWEPCRSRPQRNAYHRFTVDRHLCEAAANATALAGRVDRPDLLIVGSLLHDIGKAYPPRDHSEVGRELVTERMAVRMGFSAAETVILGDLVRHHLLLPDVATRRDLSDDTTIRLVAEAVATEQTLQLLHALTEADSLATGPAAWGEWKAQLVRELVDKASRYLSGTVLTDVEGVFPTSRHRELMVEEPHTVRAENDTITVVDADRPGLFAKVAGVLALNGLDVLAAHAHSDDNGQALAEFTVTNSFGGPVNWEKVRADVELAVAGKLAVRARLAERARVYGRRGPKALTWAPFDRKVLMDNDASEAATVIEVRAPDAVGLLYRVTSTLAEMDLDIRSAKIQTLGDHVVDAFYVRDLAGHKITRSEHLDEVERALLHALRE